MKELNLTSETFEVFQSCSSVYLDLDAHWGSDIDLIRKIITTNGLTKILDIGCGPGWHLSELAKSTNGKTQIIGLDYSPNMLREASIRLSRNGSHKKIVLIQGNGDHLPFAKEIFNLTLCLNNTLGNITCDDIKENSFLRHSFVKQIERILTLGGRAIFSVYHAPSFSRIDRYGDEFILLPHESDFGNFDFILSYKTPSGIHKYYSHWFTSDELEDILIHSGLTILETKVIGERLIIASEKISS